MALLDLWVKGHGSVAVIYTEDFEPFLLTRSDSPNQEPTLEPSTQSPVHNHSPARGTVTRPSTYTQNNSLEHSKNPARLGYCSLERNTKSQDVQQGVCEQKLAA